MEIPTKEPRDVVKGDTIKWKRMDLEGLYPSAVWTLTYYFFSRNPAKAFEVVATNAGNGFLVDLGASAELVASFERVGQSGFEWVARVSSGADKYTIGSGRLSVAPNLIDVKGGTDRRSWAVRTLDILKAVIEGRADADVNMYMLAGKQVTKMTPAELQEWYRWVGKMAQTEEEATFDSTVGARSRFIKVRLSRGS